MSEPTPLQHLARVLAKNYFDTSQTRFDNAPGRRLSREAIAQLRLTGQRVFKDLDAGDLAVQLPERTVLVVGAGASFGAFGDAYPGTSAAAQEITQLLRVSHPKPKAKRGRGSVDAEQPEIQGGPAADPVDFESMLTTLAKEFGDAAVRSALVQMYGERHHPHLGFEIIAHLFKHRFIDVIINFNFDELLDEVIEGEMGTAEYHHVVYEGQCRGLAPLLVDQRLKIPLYIKPYGTVSHPSSIRFSQKLNSRLPPAMHNLIARIIGGHWVDDSKHVMAYSPYRVNLITVGFSMQSVHLLQILDNVSGEENNSGIKIYHLNRGTELQTLAQAAAARGWTSVNEQFIDVDDYRGLAEAIRTLWIETSDHFHRPFRPRGVARHEIVHNLFFAVGPDGTAGARVPARDPDERRDNLDYFRGRLYAEVAMAIARGNGQIDLGTMSESRVGRMFELLRNCRGGRDISMHHILEPFCYGGRVEFSGRDNSVFRFQYEQANNAEELNENLARALWERLIKALQSISDDDFQERLKVLCYTEDRNDKMILRFRRLASSDAQDISPSFRPRHLLLSRQPQPNDVIHTSLGLTLRFVEMLNEPWDLMLAMTESGKVMTKYQRHVDKGSVEHLPDDKQFCLVLAKSDHPEVAESRLERYYPRMLRMPADVSSAKEGRGSPVFYIPAWAHNQHMVLLLKREGQKYTPISAVRYETPRLGNRVNPVFIRDSRADLEAALECFKRYVHMSVRGILSGNGNTEEEDTVQRIEADVLWAMLTARDKDRREAESRWVRIVGEGGEPPAPPQSPSIPLRRKPPIMG